MKNFSKHRVIMTKSRWFAWPLKMVMNLLRDHKIVVINYGFNIINLFWWKIIWGQFDIVRMTGNIERFVYHNKRIVDIVYKREHGEFYVMLFGKLRHFGNFKLVKV